MTLGTAGVSWLRQDILTTGELFLDSHGGTRAMMRSVFYTVSDFLHYYCSLMYQRRK